MHAISNNHSSCLPTFLVTFNISNLLAASYSIYLAIQHYPERTLNDMSVNVSSSLLEEVHIVDCARLKAFSAPAMLARFTQTVRQQMLDTCFTAIPENTAMNDWLRSLTSIFLALSLVSTFAFGVAHLCLSEQTNTAENAQKGPKAH